MEIENSVALVTGGASGLGRATAEALLAGGASVVLADLPSSPGADVGGRHGRARAFRAHRRHGRRLGRGSRRCRGQLGTLRVVVNCAGVGTPGKVVSRQGPMPLAQFETSYA